jgi:hypothetical protein
MEDFTKAWSAGDRRSAEASLALAVEQARAIPRLAGRATGGRVGEAWRLRGFVAMEQGDFATATTCHEFAESTPEPTAEEGSRLRREVIRRRFETSGRLAAADTPFEAPADPAASRVPPNPRRIGAASARDNPRVRASENLEMGLRLLVVARSRIYTLDIEAASSDLVLVERVAGYSSDIGRARAALKALSTWEPFSAESGSTRSSLASCSRAIKWGKEALRWESEFNYARAAEVHEAVAEQLRWMPFNSRVEKRERAAKADAFRCRQAAEAPGGR